MCTIVLLVHAHPEFPVLVAANRDELYARPWTPPQVLSLSPLVVGGRDGERGGTWMAATAGGCFAGITNQPTLELDPARRSRGEIVLGVMRGGSPWLASLDPNDFNPFNLVYGDAAGLFVAYARADQIEITTVPDGIHVLANDVLDGRHPRVARARGLFEPLAALPWPVFRDGAQAALAHPELCLHSPTYGTCSATILALERGRTAHYLFAPGPPCTTAFDDVTDLLTLP